MSKRCESKGCSNLLKGKQRRFCSTRCSNRTHQQLRRESERAQARADSYDPNESRGSAYEKLRDSGIATYVSRGTMTKKQAAIELGLSESVIGTAMRALEVDKLALEWAPTAHHSALLGPADRDPNDPGFEKFLDEMVAAFVLFRTEFFELGDGTKYMTEEFHAGWIRGVLWSIYTGEQLLILSPPRHGKSELLTHFCVWLIVRNPNIRIIWVGGSQDLAKQALKSVRQHLEDNEALKLAYLPPGVTWKPPGRSSKPWESTAFEVNTRTSILKSPSMVALGRGSTLLSRDADVLICDDIEDEKSTAQEGTRSATRRWFMKDADSRNEEKTAWVYIGSRQHPDDLPNYLLDDPNWSTIVESAHDELCDIDEDLVDAHYSCMLFPAVRTYKWLYQKLQTARVLGEEELFLMVYLNNPAMSKDLIFTKGSFQACFNRDRVLGKRGLPSDTKYVAGLDPSASGFQAAFLWGWSEKTKKLYMVAYQNRKGGGINEAFATFKDWRDRYGVHEWVVEENAFQSAIRQDKTIIDWAASNGVRLHGHTTGKNKRDDRFGVGAMARLYDQGIIDLPYGDIESKVATKTLMRQALRFHEDADKMNSRRRPSDVLMASWFPMKLIRKWMKAAAAPKRIVQTGDSMFPNLDLTA